MSVDNLLVPNNYNLFCGSITPIHSGNNAFFQVYTLDNTAITNNNVYQTVSITNATPSAAPYIPGNMNTTTSIWTCPSDGIYSFAASVGFGTPNATAQLSIQITATNVSGSYAIARTFITTDVASQLNASGASKLLAGNTVVLQASQNSGAGTLTVQPECFTGVRIL